MDARRRWGLYVGASCLAILVTLGFGGAILATGVGSTYLHEVAGVVLLGLLVVAGWAGRASAGPPAGGLPRALLALLFLVLTGLAGGALSSGLLPESFDAFPVLGLVALGLVLVEMIRFGTVAARRARSPGE